MDTLTQRYTDLYKNTDTDIVDIDINAEIKDGRIKTKSIKQTRLQKQQLKRAAAAATRKRSQDHSEQTQESDFDFPGLDIDWHRFPRQVFEEGIVEFNRREFNFASVLAEEVFQIDQQSQAESESEYNINQYYGLQNMPLTYISTWRPVNTTDSKPTKVQNQDINNHNYQSESQVESVNQSINLNESSQQSWSANAAKNHNHIRQNCKKLSEMYAKFIKDVIGPDMIKNVWRETVIEIGVAESVSQTKTQNRKQIEIINLKEQYDSGFLTDTRFQDQNAASQSESSTDDDNSTQPSTPPESDDSQEQDSHNTDATESSNNTNTTGTMIQSIPITILYQYPPTVRAFCSEKVTNNTDSSQSSSELKFKSLGRLHNDAEFGHQPGETNYWLPVTECNLENTLWVESEYGKADWRPVLLNLDNHNETNSESLSDSIEVNKSKSESSELFRFNGTLCRHLARCNSSGKTRVSLDFRCTLKDNKIFNNDWKSPYVNHSIGHGGTDNNSPGHSHDRHESRFEVKIDIRKREIIRVAAIADEDDVND